MASLEERVSRLEENYGNMEDRIQLQLDALDHRTDGLETTLGHLVDEFRGLRQYLIKWSRSIDRRFDSMEKLIHDSHSGNGATPHASISSYLDTYIQTMGM